MTDSRLAFVFPGQGSQSLGMLAELAELHPQVRDTFAEASEGAGVESIVDEMEKAVQEVPRDAFGHIRLDKVNPGAWFGKQFARMLGAEKTLVQKSGYYSRSAASNEYDLELIGQMTDLAVDAALRGEPGLIGQDEERGDELRSIEFSRIKGGKPFDITQDWYLDLLAAIGQDAPAAAPAAEH